MSCRDCSRRWAVTMISSSPSPLPCWACADVPGTPAKTVQTTRNPQLQLIVFSMTYIPRIPINALSVYDQDEENLTDPTFLSEKIDFLCGRCRDPGARPVLYILSLISEQCETHWLTHAATSDEH